MNLHVHVKMYNQNFVGNDLFGGTGWQNPRILDLSVTISAHVTLQHHNATHCNTLQHTATHCNTQSVCCFVLQCDTSEDLQDP